MFALAKRIFTNYKNIYLSCLMFMTKVEKYTLTVVE